MESKETIFIINMYNVIKSLIKSNITIATAESITGGLIVKTITDVPGSSAILKESYVVYSDEAKVNILGVDEEIIEKNGVVSKEVAYDMVKKLYEKTKRDICISTTGNAGPDVCDNKPVGRVYIGICFKGDIKTYECDFGDLGRAIVRVNTLEKVFRIIGDLIK